MRRGIILTIAVILVGMGACAAAYRVGRKHDYRLWTNADRVQPGMSVAQAKQVLGEPSWQGRCGEWFPYGWEGNCSTELGYRSAFAPVLPAYLVVQLDVHGRVISVDTIQSP